MYSAFQQQHAIKMHLISHFEAHMGKVSWAGGWQVVGQSTIVLVDPPVSHPHFLWSSPIDSI